MPTIPTYTKCNQLGCKNERSKLNGFCMEHGGKDVKTVEVTDERKQYNSIYQTPFWRSTRSRQLSIQPLCQACLSYGIVTPAAHVDHVFPWTRYGKQAFYANVFQSLCHSCHTVKTSLEQKGIFRHYGGSKPSDYGEQDYLRLTTANCGDMSPTVARN